MVLLTHHPPATADKYRQEKGERMGDGGDAGNTCRMNADKHKRRRETIATANIINFQWLEGITAALQKSQRRNCSSWTIARLPMILQIASNRHFVEFWTKSNSVVNEKKKSALLCGKRLLSSKTACLSNGLTCKNHLVFMAQFWNGETTQEGSV